MLDEPTCKFCGCTNLNPCRDRDGLPCCWATDDVCSFCALSTARQRWGPPLVQPIDPGAIAALKLARDAQIEGHHVADVLEQHRRWLGI